MKIRIYGKPPTYNINTIDDKDIAKHDSVTDLRYILVRDFDAYYITDLYLNKNSKGEMFELFQRSGFKGGLYGVIFLTKKDVKTHFKKPLKEITKDEIDRAISKELYQVNIKCFKELPKFPPVFEVRFG